MYSGTVMVANAMQLMAMVQTMSVRVSTRRIPQMPIHRLVNGPAMACPMLVAAKTRPAAA